MISTNEVKRAMNQCPYWLIAILFLIVPILPSVAAATVFGSGPPHGFINIECLAIGICALFLPRGIILGMLIAQMFLDYAYSLCYTYSFTLKELLGSLRYLALLPAPRIAAGLMSFLLGLGICAILAAIRPAPDQKWRAALALGAAVILACTVDVIDGQNFLVKHDSTLINVRFVRSPLVVLSAWQVSALRREMTVEASANKPMTSASDSVMALLDNQKKSGVTPNIVLVVVESWGKIDVKSEDAGFARELEAEYHLPRITSNYEVISAAAPFSGLTVPGEARELCHSTLGMGMIEASSNDLLACLPNLLRQRGYEALAFHGYLGQMFYRDRWYKKIGFEQTMFRKELQQAGLPMCKGAFPGICDASIAGYIKEHYLKADGDTPRFLYWVTLNAHLPVPVHPDVADDGFCGLFPTLQRSPALCSWFRIERAAHRAIADMAASNPGRPTIFVIVGDHAPPFGSADLRQRFSSTEVPYVILVPKPH
jgi:phosphoglycerol transferase MdoB-like AlkP superfamily enzyme